MADFYAALRRQNDTAPLADFATALNSSGLSTHEEAKGCDWLGAARDDDLLVHTLSQGSGYAMTLLSFDLEAHESDDED